MTAAPQKHIIGQVECFEISTCETLLVIPVEPNGWIPRIYEEEYDVWLEYRLWYKELYNKQKAQPMKRVRLGEVFDGTFVSLGKYGLAVEEVRPKGYLGGNKRIRENYAKLLEEQGFTSCFLVLLKQV